MAKNRNANPGPAFTGDASGWIVLLADDEAGIRQLAGQVRRSHGYTVLEAADSVEALEVAEQHPGPIHLLLTDWHMPRLDGAVLICRLSNRRPETAIVVMSGYIDLEAPPKAAVLRKPFHPQELLNTVNGVLEFGSNDH